MTFAIVMKSKLGACWDSHVYTNSCFKCSRYDRCIYPERIADATYDNLRKKAALLKLESDRLYDQLRDMKS